MKILLDVSNTRGKRVVMSLLSAFVRNDKELPDLYANASRLPLLRRFLAKKMHGVKWKFFLSRSEPYADMVSWLERGRRFRKAKGGVAFRTCATALSMGCRALLPVVRMLYRRSASKEASLLANYDAFLAVYSPAPQNIVKSGLKVISVLPNPSAMKQPQKCLNDAKYDWMRERFRSLAASDVVIPAFNATKEDLLVYGPNLKPENVMVVAEEGVGINAWADAVVNMGTPSRPAGSRSYYINNWHNNAPRTDLARVLLVGDISAMRLRDHLATRYNVPVDGFGTSLKMGNPRFSTQLKTFLHAHPYTYSKAVFMVGNHVDLKPAADSSILAGLREAVGGEAMLASPLPSHVQERKYVGGVTGEMVARQRDYLATLASRLGWRFIDMFQHVTEPTHTEASTAFCSGRSHVGMSHDLKARIGIAPATILEKATRLLAMSLDMKKDEGPSQNDVYLRLLKEGKIAAGESKLEFEEWESLKISESGRCRYIFVGGCLLRDFCAASTKLKYTPTAEAYTSSHSIADPAFMEGLRAMTEGKSYDVAYFNFGAHFFLHSKEEFSAAFREALSVLNSHAAKVVLLTLPELVSTGEADREECDFKNEKIRWANDQLLTVYSKDYPIVPVHQMVLKYAAFRCDYFHFERNVYSALFKEIQKQIGEPAE